MGKIAPVLRLLRRRGHATSIHHNVSIKIRTFLLDLSLRIAYAVNARALTDLS
jgi:hypothetical protein